jgi:hypothetical protein
MKPNPVRRLSTQPVMVFLLPLYWIVDSDTLSTLKTEGSRLYDS